MSEPKGDPAIKLFGKTIPVIEIPPPPAAAPTSCGPASPTPVRPDIPANGSPVQDRVYLTEDGNNSNRLGGDQEPDKAPSGIKLSGAKQEDGAQPITSEEIADPNSSAGVNDNQKTPRIDNEASTSRTEEDQNETSNSQDKTLKKPDKLLPCPRCNSMDTKFCYFNNYNVNQPRHFCKKCQRYWTAGGTMRNVPVGAGRRKNKNSGSHYRQIAIPEVLPNGIHHPKLNANGSVLTFGSDTPLCESMASVLNITNKTIQNHSQNGFCNPEELRISVPYGAGEKRDEHLSQSSVIAVNSKEEMGTNVPQDPRMQNCHSFPPQIPCFPGAPWPYAWNSAQWTPPAFFPPGFPMPFYPPPYWGCTLPGTWNVPWVAPLTSPPIQSGPTSGSNSPTLGKHSRDEIMITKPSSGQEESEIEDNNEPCLWIPKTLRIDDPGEAAKSSIWQTLGIKNDKGDSISKGSMFKAFQSKRDEKNHMPETSSVLQANPAALSRSLNFHESS
ncbi:hypothetical protein RHSIM_Rhsim08G0069900 [Rhododendron simsii]|uniref:Dof-type domain-containing protein n=1 Tax=Rhododendron simsii TaxID=118357 RepID=A0A834GMN8_RHOSS|nr:hypothetical protein RHSIM_Rhsim08G0069900 [Rhododendron simsii]